jgi:hypothetical protein
MGGVAQAHDRVAPLGLPSPRPRPAGMRELALLPPSGRQRCSNKRACFSRRPRPGLGTLKFARATPPMPRRSGNSRRNIAGAVGVNLGAEGLCRSGQEQPEGYRPGRLRIK